MNGSRSNPPRPGERASLDALSRTIEGLEARIEGLMGTAVKEPPVRQPPARELPTSRPQRPEYTTQPERPLRAPAAQIDYSDPLSQIRERQRILEASRERAPARPAQPSERPEYVARPSAPVQPRQQPAQPQGLASNAMAEIAQALVGLRQDLRKDISEGVAREMNALRSEIRDIKASAQDQTFAADIRNDMSRLADSIAHLTNRNIQPETASLHAEFEDLRSLMDGLARDDSVRAMDTRWNGFEDHLYALDTSGLRDELVSLAYRLDDIKHHLGSMDPSPAVATLENKLISIATAMEQFGGMMQPHDHSMSTQFAALDTRLDEISRAIVAGGRGTSADPSLAYRLEDRLDALALQIEQMGQKAANFSQPAGDVTRRIEALTLRIDELSHAETASRLDERIQELSALMQRSQKTTQQDLSGPLADISRKIDALELGSVNSALAERLDYLARRIDEMEVQTPAGIADDGAFRKIEGRLSQIAARLEESTAAPPTDHGALKGLEAQMAHLSSLLSEPRAGMDGVPPDFDRRLDAIESYMTTNDEYVIEAARQAAETVVESYARNGTAQNVSGADMSALLALAEDLRQLEDLTRGSDERTHRTFEALQDTLLQIADRLDQMETRNIARMPSVAQLAETTDLYEDEFALAEAAQPAASKASAIVRAAAADVKAQVAAQNDLVAPSKPVAPKKEGGKSILAGLGDRFRPTRKTDEKPTVRAMIDPSPSIDPVDIIPAEAANELLEPGSGAPDVKKILERVRASQAASRGAPAKSDTDNDRADYIAAARRAAQAAAMEMDQAKKVPAQTRKSVQKSGSAFGRYRRPILLAVGAVLLAIMAFPLAKSFVGGGETPAPAEISAMSSAAEQAPAATPDQAGMTGQAQLPAAPMTAIDTPPPAAATLPASQPQPEGERLTKAAPIDAGENATVLTPSGTPAPAQETSAFVKTDPAPAAAATAPAAAIIVPDTIEPKALADAARGGDVLALFEIGARYTEGRGAPADLKQAASWYQLAADKGFAPAQYRIANMYEKGNGLDRDIAKAKQYYTLAANQGNASAMHNLAVLYASGAGSSPDFDAAVNWFTKAANFGITDSQFNLAILYARGNGVKQDLEESYKWFAVAAKDGDKDAAQKRDEVAHAMKPDQLTSARAKADLWKVQQPDAKSNNVIVPDAWTGKGVKTASIDMKKAIQNIQAILNNNGFDAGQPDGTMGAKTVAAIKSFQKSIGQEQDGKVTDTLVKELLARNK